MKYQFRGHLRPHEARYRAFMLRKRSMKQASSCMGFAQFASLIDIVLVLFFVFNDLPRNGFYFMIIK